MEPLVGPEPEIDVNPNYETVFTAYKEILENHIEQVRAEAARRLKGEKPMREQSE